MCLKVIEIKRGNPTIRALPSPRYSFDHSVQNAPIIVCDKYNRIYCIFLHLHLQLLGSGTQRRGQLRIFSLLSLTKDYRGVELDGRFAPSEKIFLSLTIHE